MQRYSQGVEVPKIQVDKFIGKTSHAATGNITLDLTYVPISINDISIEVGAEDTLATTRFYRKISLTGKTLIVRPVRLEYSKPSVTTSAVNSGNAGADPHVHTLSYSNSGCHANIPLNEDQKAIVVVYAVK
jgi:hypothetical protein